MEKAGPVRLLARSAWYLAAGWLTALIVTTMGCSTYAVPIVPLQFDPFSLAAPASEKVTIQSVPTQASVAVYTSSGKALGKGQTPFEVRVPCKDAAIITIEAPGYQSLTVLDPTAASQGAAIFGTTSQHGRACHRGDIVNIKLKRAAASGGETASPQAEQQRRQIQEMMQEQGK